MRSARVLVNNPLRSYAASRDHLEGTKSEEIILLYRRWLVVAFALAAFQHVGQVRAFAQQNPAPDSAKTPPPATQTDEINILTPPTPANAAPEAPPLPQVRIPNFASCPIAELQRAVPELAHLKLSEDQSQLTALLDKVGAKTVEIARKTPNVISDEAVVLEHGGVTTRLDFSFLVVQHQLDSKSMVFDEYRVDLKTGEKIETEFDKIAHTTPEHSSAVNADLPIQGENVMPQTGPPTVSKGFVNQWLYFHPRNRTDSDFRYLGDQTIDGHPTLVIAFAQKPGAVRLPATFPYRDKNYPLFLQGVAWVDSTDFRIVRLRTDLLFVSQAVPLRQLTSEIQFADFRIVDAPSSVWLPLKVVITAGIGTATVHETHSYSNYRLFRAHSKILLNP